MEKKTYLKKSLDNPPDNPDNPSEMHTYAYHQRPSM